jgi:aspartate-semialdehyde dehydrogenase
MPSNASRIGIVGARGLVGSEALSILLERGYPPELIACFGSARSAGMRLDYGTSTLRIYDTDSIVDHGVDYAILCADASVARTVEHQLQESHTTIIDNSSAFRMDPRVPLVVPEINACRLHAGTRLVANPNCSTIMLVRALDPIRREIGIRGITVTTYQAVSGAGRAGLEALQLGSRAYLEGTKRKQTTFPTTCAFNVFEHESPLDPITGLNGEESKIINETRRIWDVHDLTVLPTCVRVPVERAHAQSIIIDLEKPTTEITIRDVLQSHSIQTLDQGKTLTPLDAAGEDDVIVGRIRIAPDSGGRRAMIWVCCDQIRKGAALNAIQISDSLQAVRYQANKKKSTRPGKACAEEQNRKVLA